jgi:4-hydroxyphenylacetate 3-monooxygenase
MLASGKEKLERMRDGRIVYVGAERVNDVTTHPAFRNGARTIAALYDLKADPAWRELFSFEHRMANASDFPGCAAARVTA